MDLELNYCVVQILVFKMSQVMVKIRVFLDMIDVYLP